MRIYFSGLAILFMLAAAATALNFLSISQTNLSSSRTASYEADRLAR
jgi:hypothetical protein